MDSNDDLPSSDDSDIEVTSAIDEEENELVQIGNNLCLNSDDSADDDMNIQDNSTVQSYPAVRVSEDDENNDTGDSDANDSSNKFLFTHFRKQSRPVDSKQISSIASTSIVQLIVKALENTISPAYSYASRLVCHVNMYQQHQILSLRKMSKLASFQLQKSRIVDYSHLNQHDPDFDSDSDDSSGEEDEDTTGNCTDNEYSTENDEDYVSNHLFKVSSTTFQGMRVFDSINPTLA
ncbi:unnamed protein product [Rotaria socialis]|uniref:Uncharacterized protein n=1 Tax=Rotaria socialis TaxID=392032 RepID=A0A818A6G7_9BILA|nr:unnamed protein product [Rotaria socialis]CAF4660614.1 unnamed protein product [Rotaria socialis]